MKLLFITAFNPSKNDAGSNYTRQLIMALSKEYQVDLLIFKKTKDLLFHTDSANINILKTYHINTMSRVVGMVSLPFFFPLFTSRFKWSIVNDINYRIKNGSYDLIYFDFSQTFIYSCFIKHPRKLLMAHDVIYQRYYRRKNFFLSWIKWSERFLLCRGGIIFTFSNKDCLLIKQLYGLESKSTSFFIQEEAILANPGPECIPYFIFYGNWIRPDNYEALQWFIDNVYPILNRNIHFKIIGGGLSFNIISQIQNLSNVEYLGFVDDPYSIIANANALISPLMNGAGVKVKVIESFACGTPVIGTILSFEGIDKQYKDFSIVAQSPEEFKNKIESFNISLSEKQSFKKRFIASYNDKQILKYLKSLDASSYNGYKMD